MAPKKNVLRIEEEVRSQGTELNDKNFDSIDYQRRDNEENFDNE